MTAAVLSPTEHAEASRFGIHDLEVLAEMEEHADDEFPCVIHLGRHCAEPATCILVCRECERHIGGACDAHAVFLTVSDWPATHRACDAHAPVRDLVRVVPL